MNAMKQMNRWITGFLLVICALLGSGSAMAQLDLDELSPEDQNLLAISVQSIDEGLSEAVVADFDYLAQKYPKNYIVQYERLYTMYLLGRYDELIKKRKFMLNHKYTNAATYQIIGNAYDMAGNSKEAAKVYNQGLKKYPESGSLYLEFGTLCRKDEDYEKALIYYNKGIVADPNFASNYYRASDLLISSEKGKVWGLVYAESAILLAPSDESRHEDLAKMIIFCLKNSITTNYEDSIVVSVKLTPTRGMTADKAMQNVYIEFPGIYEGALCKPLTKLAVEKTPFVGDIPQLIELRKGLVENYFSITDDLYGNSMYLLEFQKRIIDAGHWDAYNYFLFSPCYPEEFEKWFETHDKELEKFVNWFNNTGYRLGDGRSVDYIQIFNSYRPLNIIESLMIQSELLSKTEKKE